jgi:hypothetical protein
MQDHPRKFHKGILCLISSKVITKTQTKIGTGIHNGDLISLAFLLLKKEANNGM